MEFPTAPPGPSAPTSEVLEFLDDMEIHPDRDKPHIQKMIKEAERDLARRFNTKEHGERSAKRWAPLLLDPPGSFSTTEQLEEFLERHKGSEHPQLKSAVRDVQRELYRRERQTDASVPQRGEVPWNGLDLYHGPRSGRFDPLLAQLQLVDREGNVTFLGLLVFVPLIFLAFAALGAVFLLLRAWL